MLETKTLKLSDLTISYLYKKGSNNHLPTLLFVHGNSCDKSIFRKIIDTPSFTQYNAIAIDLPGHGDSFFNKEITFNINYCAQVIKEFTEKIKIHSPILIGHSLGGHIVNKLSMIMESAGLIIFQAPPIEYISDMPKAFNLIPEFNCMFMANPDDATLISLIEKFSYNVETQQEISSLFKKTNPQIRELLAQSLGGTNTFFGEISHLKKYPHPFLVIHGENDLLVNFHYLKEITPNIELVKNGGHYPTLNSPAEFIEHLKNFLNLNFCT
jgi:pimeloyl-ACP methyl ester carboxylesterase